LRVGISLGERVGLWEGDAVGNRFGEGDGKILDFPVGISLGERVGLLEGDAVGNRLGEGDVISVGALEGLTVGNMLGEGDGISVGALEGLAVSSRLGESSCAVSFFFLVSKCETFISKFGFKFL